MWTLTNRINNSYLHPTKHTAHRKKHPSKKWISICLKKIKIMTVTNFQTILWISNATNKDKYTYALSVNLLRVDGLLREILLRNHRWICLSLKSVCFAKPWIYREEKNLNKSDEVYNVGHLKITISRAKQFNVTGTPVGFRV